MVAAKSPPPTNNIPIKPSQANSPSDVGSPSQHTYPLRRVLSAGSSASGSNVSSSLKSAPMSPSSQGARTPKAGKTQQLASDMDGLNVRSPGFSPAVLPSSEASGISQVLNGNSNTSGRAIAGAEVEEHEGQSGESNRDTQSRSYSSSTESTSSSSQHPVPPSLLGSSYGPEGFPTFQQSPENSPLPCASYLNGGYFGNNGNLDPELAAKQAAALAKADEAVRQLNNTATLFKGPVASGLPYTDNSFQVPRSYANFVTPHPPNPSVTRQSSTSSSTTDAASTSSEESDWCIPSIEWVPANQWQHPTYLNSPGAKFGKKEKDRASASSRMPPPSTTPASPRRSSAPHDPPPIHHRNSLPFGASAATPPLQSPWAAPALEDEVEEEDEEDAATVGYGGRDRSASASSQSAQSGLDLLWRAAHASHHAPYDPSFEHKGKRKAGAEAVDKWRSSGIPMGAPPTAEQRERGRGAPSTSGPPKKRRRSELDEEMDEDAKEEAMVESVKEEDEDEVVMEEASSYHSPSTSEGPASDHESEYGGRRGRTTRGRGRGRGGSVRGARGGAGNASLPSAPGGITKQGTIKKVRKVGDSPTGAAKGGRKITGAAVPPGGVRCDYINPLSPYNRCTDVFTRKYDLPRHMARHARREGELVVEGKLTEEKAVLWRTIKDKPKVVCQSCGESFTRMDALKRHQQKQHH